MSIPITIELDTTAVERALSDIGRKQVPFALALTINDLAAEVKSKEIVANKVDLDRPTPFTSKGIFIVRANKSTLQGQVGYKDRQADYLDKQVTGGKKRAKKKAIVVPVAMKLNKYGNLPRNALSRQIARKDVFVGTVKGVAGVWKRPRRTKSNNNPGLTLLAIFKSSVTYQPRLKFNERAVVTVSNGFSRTLVKRLDQAIKTAR